MAGERGNEPIRQDLTPFFSCLQFVCLNPARAEIERRMRAREGHFMPPSLVASQLACLELGDDLAAVIGGEGEETPDQIVRTIIDTLITAGGDGDTRSSKTD